MLGKIVATVGVAYLLDVTIREVFIARKAKKLAKKVGKPLLNVGSGTDSSSATGAKLRGDINCDIAASRDAKCGSSNVCYCNAEKLQFADKQFGVALAINILPYVPNRSEAIKELHRVAEHVIISDNILPWPQLGPGPVFPV
jgi:ubiquinone/menaquinone biosynthesis C-methylase UbiE